MTENTTRSDAEMAGNENVVAPVRGKIFPPVRACLFDMDGLLIDSEDKYTLVTNIILREYGRPDLPWHIKAQLQGRPGPEAARIFHSWANLPIKPETYNTKLASLQRKHFPDVRPLPGVKRLLQQLQQSPSKPFLALATSSHKVNYKLKTDHLEKLFSVFEPDLRVLGDDARVPKGRGKPCPDIYLLALDLVNTRIAKLNATRGEHEQIPTVRPIECLVFEDSVPGIEAGRRAGMRVVWVPHPGLREEYRGSESEVLSGNATPSSHEALEAVGDVAHDSRQLDERLRREMREKSSGTQTPASRNGDESDAAGTGTETDTQTPLDITGHDVDEAIDALDEGWAELLESLEHFDYSRYGLLVEKEN